MTTQVGTQTSFIEAVKELIELDYDAVEAYEVAIKNLEKSEYKKKLESFKEDHHRHIKELSDFLSRCNEEAPTGPDNIKHLMAMGKVKLGALFGDKNILKAMISNEEDTNEAYKRMNSRVEEASDPKIAQIIGKGLEDERRHKEWLVDTIEEMNNNEDIE